MEDEAADIELVNLTKVFLWIESHKMPIARAASNQDEQHITEDDLLVIHSDS